MSTPLDAFGLPGNASERDVKRAYAARLKAVRPDIDPAGFQQLHDLYQSALAYCGQISRAQATAPEAGNGEAAPDIVESAPPPPPKPTTRRPVATAGAWHRVDFGADVRESEPDQPPLDADAFVSRFLDLATDQDAESVRAWLQSRHELWSLRAKQEIGRAVLQRLFSDAPPIRTSSFDATLEFFGMDHALSGIDPLRLQQLRLTMQERHALVARFEPATQAWGEHHLRFDFDAFYAWIRAQAIEGDGELLAAHLFAQPALRRPDIRQQAAASLLQRLVLDSPAMPQDCAGRLIDFFGLSPLVARNGQHPRELVAQLHMKWLLLPQNKGKLTVQVRDPKERYGDLRRTARLRYWLERPFHWGLVLMLGLVPRLPTSLGLFLWRFSGGVPARLHRFFDPRAVNFWLATADRTRLSRSRVIVGAIRCLFLLLLGGALSAWWQLNPISPFTPDIAAGTAIMIAGALTAMWLCYLAFWAACYWQCKPEHPAVAWPWLRMGFIPLLCALGLACRYLSDFPYADQALLLPTALLAWMRFRRRNPPKEAKKQDTNDIWVGLLILSAMALLLGVPALAALVALAYWIADLVKQRKQLHFRRRVELPPSSTRQAGHPASSSPTP
jgi:hypothetical protein